MRPKFISLRKIINDEKLKLQIAKFLEILNCLLTRFVKALIFVWLIFFELIFVNFMRINILANLKFLFDFTVNLINLPNKLKGCLLKTSPNKKKFFKLVKSLFPAKDCNQLQTLNLHNLLKSTLCYKPKKKLFVHPFVSRCRSCR